MPNLQEIVILLLVGFTTGFINTVAGGGSLISLPVLMFMGLPHTVANGTNRIPILTQTAFGLAGFKTKSVTSFPISIHQGLVAIVGSVIGVELTFALDQHAFSKIISTIMIADAGLLLFKPKAVIDENYDYNTRMRYWLSMIGFFFLGIYGGFIQAGLGFLSVSLSMSINGFNIHQANHAKIFVTLCITVIAVILFLMADAVAWMYALPMAVTSSLGAWIASRWSVDRGEKAVRIFMVVTIILLAIKLALPDIVDGFINLVISLFA